MINKKLQTIVDLINKSNIIIDVGCDHCFLAIELLKQNKTNHMINIDINQKPLSSGIKNLVLYNLYDKTTNIINNGLKDIELKNNIFNTIKIIDYCVIAGMGSANIIDILKHNKLEIKYYILQSSKDEWKLRKYLIDNYFMIISETYVYDNGVFYPIFMVKKTKLKQSYNKQEIYYGKIRNIKNQDVYINMLKSRQLFFDNFFKLHNSNMVKNNLKEEYKLLNQRLKHYI